MSPQVSFATAALRPKHCLAPQGDEVIEVYRLSASRKKPSNQSCAACATPDTIRFVQTAFDELLAADSELSALVTVMKQNGLKAVIFGGWTRDRLAEHLYGRTNDSRDIDFVANGTQSVKKLFPVRAIRNPFGGVGFDSSRIHIDAWDLPDTFLFRLNALPVEFSQLPDTADYNVNAVIFQPAQFFHRAGLLDCGAGTALQQGELDFMADTVAQPRVQAARSVILATRLRLTLSATVQDFVRDICSTPSAAEAVMSGIASYCPAQHQSQARIRLQELLGD